MKRNDVINILLDLAGSVGPFRKIDSVEDWIKLHNDKYDIMDSELFDVLLDILLNPPDSNELGRVSEEDFEYELGAALTSIGKRKPVNCLERIEKLLYVDKSRPVIIDFIGGLQLHQGIPLLQSILENVQLNDDELIRLVSAFGEIGGIKSCENLKRMQMMCSGRTAEVLSEIEIGIKDANKKKDE